MYRVDTNGSVIEITHEVEKPNGIVLSPDQRTLYVGDHNNGGNRLKPTDPEPKRGAMKVYAFPLDDQGVVKGPRRTLVDFGIENGCDGMTVNQTGNLYLSCRSLARPGIKVIDPNGKELAFFETGPRNQKGLRSGREFPATSSSVSETTQTRSTSRSTRGYTGFGF